MARSILGTQPEDNTLLDYPDHDLGPIEREI